MSPDGDAIWWSTSKTTESGSSDKLAVYGCNWHMLSAVAQCLMVVISISYTNNTSEWICNLHTQSAIIHAAPASTVLLFVFQPNNNTLDLGLTRRHSLCLYASMLASPKTKTAQAESGASPKTKTAQAESVTTRMLSGPMTYNAPPSMREQLSCCHNCIYHLESILVHGSAHTSHTLQQCSRREH